MLSTDPNDPLSPMYGFKPQKRPDNPLPARVEPSTIPRAPCNSDELKEYVQQCSKMAAETLVYFASDPSRWKGLALAAAKELLDRAHGKPVAPIEAKVAVMTLEQLVAESYKVRPKTQDMVALPIIEAP